jgi:hypothetical protein
LWLRRRRRRSDRRRAIGGKKTGHCVIAHKAARTAGFGAEIAAQLQEHAIAALLACIERVTGYGVVMPRPKLEMHDVSGTRGILEACDRVMAWGGEASCVELTEGSGRSCGEICITARIVCAESEQFRRSHQH